MTDLSRHSVVMIEPRFPLPRPILWPARLNFINFGPIRTVYQNPMGQQLFTTETPKASVVAQESKASIVQVAVPSPKSPRSSDITCPLCMDSVTDPVTTECGHIYCELN